MHAEAIDTLVPKLSDALLSGDLTPWLTATAREFGASKFSLMPIGESPWQSGGCWFGWTEAEFTSYAHYYNRVDILTARMRSARDMTVYRLGDLLSQDEIVRSEIYNDFWLPADAGNTLSLAMDFGPSNRFLMGCVRPADADPFTKAEANIFARYARYVKEFIRVSLAFQQNGASARTLGWTLDRLSLPTYLVNSAFRIVFSNKEGLTLLNANDVLRYRKDSGLGGVDPRLNTDFRNAISSVLNGDRAQAVVPLHPRSARAPRTAIVMRAPPEQLGVLPVSSDEPRVIVFVIKHEVSKRPPSQHYLSAAFRFTPKEAEIASLLATGASLDEIATRMTVTRDGIRYHLRQLFLKTGTHGQRELVQLITVGEGLLKCPGKDEPDAG